MGRFLLQPEAISRTIDKLSDRISERFPSSGLYEQSRTLLGLSQMAEQRAKEVVEPIRWIRLLYLLLIVLLLIVVVVIPVDLRNPRDGRDVIDWLQILESAINDVILLGAGLAFLASFETRLKRRKVMAELHQIRSFAHVIDMHQLTKDPQRVLDNPERQALGTESSPAADMTSFELSRYFDYCSELLSLSAKVAAIYVQNFNDADALDAVNEIEQLTTGLSRKIWQKSMILSQTS